MSAETTIEHVKTQLRRAVAAAVTGLPTTGGRVFQARAWPLQENDMPCLLVHTSDESIDTKATGPVRIQSRRVSVVVVAMAMHSDAVEDDLDRIAAEVEAAVFAATPVRALTKSLELTATDSALSAEASFVVGQIRLSFSAVVHAVEGDPIRRAP